MAEFSEHISKSKHNLEVLGYTNKSINSAWDWQVTIAYYTAVHLMNGHLAKVSNLHYSSHKELKNALYADLSPAKVPQEIYLAYTKLEGLSRRSRYLCHEDSATAGNLLTYDKHLKKALVKLDQIILYFKSIYGIDLPTIDIKCIEIRNLNFTYFKHVE